TASGAPNGVVMFDPDAEVLRTLDSAEGRYRALTWREESAQLAVLRARPMGDEVDEAHDLLVWDDAGRGPPRVLEGVGRRELADTVRIVERAGIRFADDGRSVFVGLRPWAGPGPASDTAARPDARGADE